VIIQLGISVWDKNACNSKIEFLNSFSINSYAIFRGVSRNLLRGEGRFEMFLYGREDLGRVLGFFS